MLAEVLATDFDLLELDFKLFALLDRLCLFFLGHVSHSLLITDCPLDISFKVDCAISDLSVLGASSCLFIINIVVDLLLLLLVLVGGFLLTL